MPIHSQSHAGLIEEGYSLDESENIVTGAGLEWLQWDETIGQSMTTALSNNASAGWRIASNADMAQLFNDADFDHTFDADENTQDITYESWAAGDDSSRDQFLSLFGMTFEVDHRGYVTGDHLMDTRVLFGLDLDGDDLFNIAMVRSDWTTTDGRHAEASAHIFRDIYPQDHPDFLGVALVRSVDVPEPGTLALFLAGLAGITLSRRKL